jgi:hypothetical protein
VADGPTLPRTKLADPEGLIARVRSRLNPQCAVRLSPYCDVIIAMRMQGVDFRGIEKWLLQQGDQFRIPPATLHRNLRATKLQVNLTYAEEMLERMGGQVDIDLVTEMSKTVWTQKQRVDLLVRDEQTRRAQPGSESYMDRRIRHELEVYNELLRALHTVLQEAPIKARQAAEAEQQRLDSQGITATKDALVVLRDLILNDELRMGGSDANPTGPTKH